jgi:RNA polymerase sigma factor (sigma-70 family)
MPSNPLNRVLQNLRRITGRQAEFAATDGELLRRFLAARDETAFAALVRRHGPMVLGVCRRVLGDRHDADDAFQAAFLVLVRKAGSVVPRERVGNWLYGVACRTALAVKAARARRRIKESHVRPAEMFPQEPDPADHLDLLDRLDIELAALPEKYRAAVVCCELEGKPRKEAAKLLGCPEGTLATRLKRARQLLARRLSGRGAAVSAGVVSLLLSQSAVRAALPGPLVVSTVRAAVLTAAGRVHAVSAKLAGITEGVVKAMLLSKLRILTAVALLVGVLALGAGVFTDSALAQKAGEKAAQKEPAAATSKGPKAGGAFRVLKADHGVVCLRYGPDEKTLAIVTWEFKDGVINSKAQLRDPKTGEVKQDLDETTVDRNLGLHFHLRQVAFSRDGKLLAASIDGIRNLKRYGEIKVWDAEGRELKHSLTHDSDIDSVAFSPDGKRVFGGGSLDGKVIVWKLGDGTVDREIKVGAGVRAVAISPDGKTLAAGCWKSDEQGEVSLWDLETGLVKHRMSDQDHGLFYSVAFSPDGKKVAACGWDKIIRVWETETGLLKHVLESPVKGFREVNFSPDGKLLAAAGPPEVQIWDIENARLVQRLPGHRGEVFSAVFSARGDVVTSCGTDKTIRFWKVRPPAGK